MPLLRHPVRSAALAAMLWAMLYCYAAVWMPGIPPGGSITVHDADCGLGLLDKLPTE